MGSELFDPEAQRKKELDQINCPICQKAFSSSIPSIFNSHVKKCVNIKVEKCSLYPSSQDIVLNDLIFKNQKIYLQNQRYNDCFKAIEEKVNDLKQFIINSNKDLEETNYIISVNRQDLLKDAMDITEQIYDNNVFQRWKINFIGEVSYDVGGLLREFFTNIFQILESDKLKLFIPSDSSDFSYILNPFLDYNEENVRYCKFIGLLLAKALMQNVTINVCFNKIIYKMILQEKIEFEDLVFIDGTLYNSLRNLKENIEYNKLINPSDNSNNILLDLGIFYSIELKDCNNHLHYLDLIENGRNINVENIDNYIEKRINLLIGIYEPFIKEIRNTLFKYIPKDKIFLFNSNELELILNGRPFIDLEEWKLYTIYKAPYNQDHQVIKWFWEILSKLSQKELSNLLLFSTGASRVPLGGFAELESNKGNISQFTIEYINYNKKSKNFIKAHTCFNKIDLPCFNNKHELEEAIHFVSEKEMWGFGIE